jgi:hypothetical protein
MQVIIYSQNNGHVAVCTPTGELPIEEVLTKDCPEGAIIVDSSSLPHEHNDFFNAWELNGTAVTVNLDKAKAITKDRLRQERAPLLQKLDVDYQRADEASEAAKKAEVVAEKQRLRDITQLADQATTLDELKAITVGA